MPTFDKKKYLLHIGNRIKTLRLERKLSQEELALKSGYTSRSTINKIELGYSDIPQTKLKDITIALGVEVKDILNHDTCENDSQTISNRSQLIGDNELLLLIEEKHGNATKEALTMYVQLDANDKGEIRGEMKQMLKSAKYQKKAESKSA